MARRSRSLALREFVTAFRCCIFREPDAWMNRSRFRSVACPSAGDVAFSCHRHTAAPPAPPTARRSPGPPNGIYADSVKTYDEATLHLLLNKAVANLSQLNGFSPTVTNQLGQIQGSAANQAAATLTAGTGTPTSPTAPPTYSLPSGFQTSRGVRQACFPPGACVPRASPRKS